MYNGIAIFIGVLIALMVGYNGILAEGVGNYTSTVIIHLVGLVVVTAALLFTKSKVKLKNNVPIYLYSAGVMGVLTVSFNNSSFIVLGASITLALGLLGQAVASFIIDHFGLLGMPKVKFKKEKMIGILLVCIGIGCMMFA